MKSLGVDSEAKEEDDDALLADLNSDDDE